MSSSTFSSPGSGPRVAGFIVGGIGLVLGAAGYVVWRYAPGIAAAEHARLVALPSPDPIMLTDLPAGLEVLMEGEIATDQPAVFRDFVAYVKEEEQRDQRERERSGNWKVVETVTPPLQLIAGDGSVRVLNANYGILFARSRWRDSARIIDTSYSGLVAGEAVFVRGRVATGGVEAIAVGSGTRASYLATIAGNVAVGWWLGVGFMALGTLMAAIAVVLFVTAARQAQRARQPVPWPPEPGAAR